MFTFYDICFEPFTGCDYTCKTYYIGKGYWVNLFVETIEEIHQITPVLEVKDGVVTFLAPGWELFKIQAFIKKSTRTFGEWKDYLRPIVGTTSREVNFLVLESLSSTFILILIFQDVSFQESSFQIVN